MTTVLITGASSGIGLASSIAATQAGMTVVATVRDMSKVQPVPGVEFVELDVTSAESIADCVAGVIRRHGRLDALVNNAGVAGSNPTCEVMDFAELRDTMEVNFFGTVAMSQAALPHLRASRGRLITVSSVRGVIGQPFNEAYSASKFAVEGFMEALAPVAAQAGVTVCLIEPAAVIDTEFISNSSDDVANMCDPGTPYEPAFRAYRSWVRSGAIEGAQKAHEVASVIIRALTGDRPPLRLQTSDYGRAYISRKLADPDGTAIQAMTGSWVS